MKIVQFPHPSLRWVARPLTAIDQKVIRAADELVDLMIEARGLGLAAPQVALPYQLIVLNPNAGDPPQRDQAEVWINPVILERKGSVEDEEGCLSFPKLYAKVRRAKTVKVQAYNLKGEALEINASDLAARVWQHEVDHLHGILFIDKMGPIARLASRGALKEFEREFHKARERGEIPPDVEIEQLREVLAAQA
jgi:peptide deformylase